MNLLKSKKSWPIRLKKHLSKKKVTYNNEIIEADIWEMISTTSVVEEIEIEYKFFNINQYELIMNYIK